MLPLRFYPAAIGLLVLGGCGGNPNLGKVSGTIHLDGKPLPNAMITFTPAEGGATSFGKSDESGHYRMTFSDSQMGAWIGVNKVEIRTGDVLPDNSGRTPELVPAVYNAKSTLTADVQQGSNNIDFELDSKASKVQEVQVSQ